MIPTAALVLEQVGVREACGSPRTGPVVGGPGPPQTITKGEQAEAFSLQIIARLELMNQAWRPLDDYHGRGNRGLCPARPQPPGKTRCDGSSRPGDPLLTQAYGIFHWTQRNKSICLWELEKPRSRDLRPAPAFLEACTLAA